MEGRDKAVAAATQVLERDSALVEAHTVLASVFTPIHLEDGRHFQFVCKIKSISSLRFPFF